MICPACSEGEHESCDDVIRYRGFVKWLQSKPDGIGTKSRPVGQAELSIIRANTPYNSCPCQHKARVVAESHLPG